MPAKTLPLSWSKANWAIMSRPPAWNRDFTVIKVAGRPTWWTSRSLSSTHSSLSCVMDIALVATRRHQTRWLFGPTMSIHNRQSRCIHPQIIASGKATRRSPLTNLGCEWIQMRSIPWRVEIQNCLLGWRLVSRRLQLRGIAIGALMILMRVAWWHRSRPSALTASMTTTAVPL